MPANPRQHFIQHPNGLHGKKQYSRWKVWWVALNFTIWQHRNRLIFSNEPFNGCKLMEEAMFLYLNTNHDLYDAVKKAEQECHMLSEEAQRGVRNLRADFERGGIHLCPEKLDRVNKLNIEISQLCREYVYN
ncbi:Mitochondrial intermediate peptidase, mitochondrial [Glycine soja]|uniref:Mitochondrial intermediate peptidase, mitochondrial n=1 Tax=Glycine soja TaxID=3848 RepID=A0A445KZ51_GLYSO|nr:Mitochondrial intermediate peptidase, mitochondrial [Glycine soja]